MSTDAILHDLNQGNQLINYSNYDGKIVERYSIALVGWPFEHPVCNPGEVGSHGEVSKLLDALQGGVCKWVRLSDKELEEQKKNNQRRQANGEQVYKSRCKPKTTSRKPSADIVIDDEENTVDREACVGNASVSSDLAAVGSTSGEL
jgi:hypothetical protein